MLIMNGGALGQKFANRLFIIFRLSSKLGISNWSVFLLFGQLVSGHHFYYISGELWQ